MNVRKYQAAVKTDAGGVPQEVTPGCGLYYPETAILHSDADWESWTIAPHSLLSLWASDIRFNSRHSNLSDSIPCICP